MGTLKRGQIDDFSRNGGWFGPIWTIYTPFESWRRPGWFGAGSRSIRGVLASKIEGQKVKILKNGVEVGEGVVHLWLGGRGSEAWTKGGKRGVIRPV